MSLGLGQSASVCNLPSPPRSAAFPRSPAALSLQFCHAASRMDQSLIDASAPAVASRSPRTAARHTPRPVWPRNTASCAPSDSRHNLLSCASTHTQQGQRGDIHDHGQISGTAAIIMWLRGREVTGLQDHSVPKARREASLTWAIGSNGLAHRRHRPGDWPITYQQPPMKEKLLQEVEYDWVGWPSNIRRFTASFATQLASVTCMQHCIDGETLRALFRDKS